MMQPVITITLPIKTVSEANTGGKLRAKIRRKKEQEHIIALAMSQFDARKVKLPAVVRLTRLSFGELDDDNLRGAMKKIRDGVAAWIGIDDGDVTQVMYQYAQGFAARKTYAVTIEVFGGYKLRETMEECE